MWAKCEANRKIPILKCHTHGALSAVKVISINEGKEKTEESKTERNRAIIYAKYGRLSKITGKWYCMKDKPFSIRECHYEWQLF